MEKAELRALFENEYPGKEKIVEQLIKPIFAKAKDTTKTDERELSEADKKQIKSFRIIAQVRGGFPITFADVEVNDSVALKRSRVNIQSCVRKVLENDSNAIIFFHFSDNAKEWRVSYCHRATSNKESTDAKRYTYLCGTEHACRTIAERFDTLKGLTTIKDEDMLNAFGVEPLSKEFFDQYREHYADLVEYISGKRFIKKGGKFVEEKTKNANGAFKNVFDGNDKLVRDYVKKTMGRLVFLHFLQKKGWLGVAKEAAWGAGDKNFIYNLFLNAGEEVKNDFLEQALEPLFFKTLNTDRGEEALAPKAVCGIYGREIRIPYLNGGLFEEDELDKKKVKFKKEHFETLLEFFNQYNFTIDETDPDDQEIGVDPEMLGKIFENLLEDNKDKGAFYTPKEIVQYMCRESLIAYLNEKTKLDARAFVINHEIAFTDAQKADLLKALLDVKVCDPAVGSGAFPMGMLNELLACTQLLTGNSKTRSELKKHIVKNNIYGVDIEKGAVDIARLRFWLAIIVDEEEPIPLPNLDYKIMQGNSLLDSYEGIDLSNLCTAQEDSLFDDSNEIKTLLQYLENYFDKHEEKNAIREAIKASVMELLKKRGISGKQYDALEKLDLHENNQFFLWHTWFNDVFNRPNKCNGFDIVIGNPPYINVQFMSEQEKELYKKDYSVFIKRCDMFALFVQLGLEKISSKNGIVVFIIPSVVHSNMSYTKLRDIILNNHWLKEVCYTGGDVFNAPTVDTTILICDKRTNENIALKNAVDFEKQMVKTVPSDYFSTFDNVISIGGGNDSDSLFAKVLNKDFAKLDESFTVYQGIVTGNNPAFIFETEKEALENGVDKELLHPLCHGRDIEKYKVRSRDRCILYIDESVNINKYPKTKKWLLQFKDALDKRNQGKKDTISWCSLHRPRVKSELDLKEKILIQRTRNEALKTRIVATLDDESVYGSEGIYFIIPKNEDANLHFLLGILNSKLMNYLFATKFLNLAIKAEYVKQLRLPPATPAQQQEIITLVDKILAAKKASAGSATKADTTALEHKIDELVYKLYGLTDEEIAIVEGK